MCGLIICAILSLQERHLKRIIVDLSKLNSNEIFNSNDIFYSETFYQIEIWVDYFSYTEISQL